MVHAATLYLLGIHEKIYHNGLCCRHPFQDGNSNLYCMMTSFTWFTPLWCSQSSLCHRGVMKAKLLLLLYYFNFSLISRASLCSRISWISQTAEWFSSGDDARQIPLDSMSHDEMSDEVWDNLVLHPSTHIVSNLLLCTQSSFTFHGLFINFALPTHILLRILWVGFLDESQDFLLWCKTKNKLGYFTQKDDWFQNIWIHAVKLQLIMQVSVNQGQVSELEI